MGTGLIRKRLDGWGKAAESGILLGGGYGVEMENEIAAVVVTYNRKELLRQCLDKLLNQEGAACDIIVIDNASEDGTAEMVQQEYRAPRVIYVNTGQNLGGAGGFRTGARQAVKLGYKYIWMMDDDTLPESDALCELVKADRKLEGNWGFLSSAAYWTDGEVCVANRQKKTIFTFIGGEDYKRDLVPVVMGSFVSLYVKSSIVREVGLPIAEYYIWTDDYEFCGRISQRYECYAVTKSRVVHAMKNHVKANLAMDHISRIDRYRCLFRNDVHCYRRYGLKGWIYIISKDMYNVANILLHAKDGKAEKVKALLDGVKEGIRFFPQIEMIDFR